MQADALHPSVAGINAVYLRLLTSSALFWYYHHMQLFRKSYGFAYIALLVVIVIIGISLGAAGRYWSNVVLRDKEEELLFRGDQYRRAIEQYYRVGSPPQYPSSIDDLLKDNRTGGNRRLLRQRYKDPISGKDFVEIRHMITKRIIGVTSPSDKQPLKQADFPAIYNSKQPLIQLGFPVGYNEFIGKYRYSEWLFVSTIQEVAPASLSLPQFLPRRTVVPRQQ